METHTWTIQEKQTSTLKVLATLSTADLRLNEPCLHREAVMSVTLCMCNVQLTHS